MQRFLWLLFLFTMFWQTRVALCCQGQVVDYLIPFIYLSDVLVLALLVSFLFRVCVAHSRPRCSSIHCWGLVLGVGVFLLLVAVPNFSAVHPLGAWYKWFKLAGFVVFSFTVAKTHPEGVFSDRSGVWRWVVLGLVPIAFIAWGEFLLQRSLGLQFMGEWQFSAAMPGIAKVMLAGKQLMRPYATFPHPNVLGGVFSLFAIVNLWWFLEESNAGIQNLELRIQNSKTKRYIGFFLLFTSVVLISFSRSAWAAYVAMLGMTLWVNRNRLHLPVKNLKHLKLLTAAAAVMVVLLVAPRLATLATSDALSWERRMQLNRAAIAMIKDHPLTGVGLNNFVPNLEKYFVIVGKGRFLQPAHNVPLLIAAEIGLPAFLILASCFLILFFKLWQRREYLLLTLWLGITITAMFDHYWFTLQHGLLTVALTLGVSLSKIMESEV